MEPIKVSVRLNPYCTGTYTTRCRTERQRIFANGLNPYCIGTYTTRKYDDEIVLFRICLNPYCIGTYTTRNMKRFYMNLPQSLNPYCIGTYTTSKKFHGIHTNGQRVLILIVLELTLRVLVIEI